VTTKDADGKPVVKEEVKVFQYTDIGTTSVAKSAEIKDGVPLGVYLFFNDISANVVRNETLTATVGAGAEEFNLFVVNAAAEYETVKSREKVKPLPNYSLEVYYRYQKDNKIYRVFSNLAPEDIRYLAYNSASQIKYTRMDMSGSLVEKKVKNLLYGINISLFEQNSNFKGNPIVSFDTEKLA
ncbi:MAG: hypothetical protein RR743_03840, partial [Oscillospiraceae bacterium]